MSSKDIAVSVRGLSKAYTIAHNAPQHTMVGEALVHRLKNPFQRVEKETFWALKDVEFDIQKGEVVGIIGRNGAGKSTLLKILSRITKPTTGQIDLYGRVGSLLEVGTGFHPELTGRENIFLNGAILGMRKREIERQFDAIVDFAGVEKFLDTPVKRYSSGMYVRLAFAVAAHLNPEILIVDEVLAVGDAEFQKKCLGKMQDVAQSGRTVLFVSHNMDAVIRLCSKAIVLREGKVATIGDTSLCIAEYLKSRSHQTNTIDLQSVPRPISIRGQIKLNTVRQDEFHSAWKSAYGDNIAFTVGVEVISEVEEAELAIALLSSGGFEIASTLSSHRLSARRINPGFYEYTVEYLSTRLSPGIYRFSVAVNSNFGLEDYISEAFEIEVTSSDLSSVQKVDHCRGALIPEVEFQLKRTQEILAVR